MNIRRFDHKLMGRLCNQLSVLGNCNLIQTDLMKFEYGLWYKFKVEWNFYRNKTCLRACGLERLIQHIRLFINLPVLKTCHRKRTPIIINQQRGKRTMLELSEVARPVSQNKRVRNNIMIFL